MSEERGIPNTKEWIENDDADMCIEEDEEE